MSKNKNNFIPPKKQQKQDTKKPIFWVLFFLIIFWTVSGILGVCSFIGLSPSSDNTLIVNADSVTDTYTYDGNNFFVPTSSYTYTDNPNAAAATNLVVSSPYFLSIDVKLSMITNNQGILSPSISISSFMDNRNKSLTARSFGGSSDGYIISYENDYVNLGLYAFGLNSNNGVPTRFQGNYQLYFSDRLTSGYSGVYGYITCRSMPEFNCDVRSIRYSSTVFESVVGSGSYMGQNYNTVTNTVTYTDSNSNTFELSFIGKYLSSSVLTGVVAWEYREYYISNIFTDNEYYQNGYNQGYEQGKQDNRNNGYQTGYNNGFSAGKSQGYNEGVLDANNYSFLGLMTAVIDAPIQALTGLFGFELLGVNLMSVISGLFTVCVILVLLRLLLGGGLSG